MRYYYIKIIINTTHKSSYFTGSMFRGAFGYALKKVTCINPSYRCENCFAKDSCLYYSFYEEQNIIHNYRFEIELGTNNFDFGLYIFEDTTKELPYILSALEIMLSKNGLTKNNYTFNDIKIVIDSTIVYKNQSFLNINILPTYFQLDTTYQDVKIKLQTPIRIKKDNKLLKDNIDIEDILRSINQRYMKLVDNKDIYKLNYTPNYTPNYTNQLKELYHKPLLRNSNRQKSKMNMDGIMGEIIIKGLDKESYRLLKIGEIIGVGKQSVMGLGQIKLEEIDE